MRGTSLTGRYLAFEADLGGFNNILMQLEIMVVLAWLTRRTLILPPAKPFYLLGDVPRSLLDFFDLEAMRNHVDAITAEEFAPECSTHEAFHESMSSLGQAPGWNALKDAFLYPNTALTDRLDLIPRLHGRRCVGITEVEESCRILGFPNSVKHRMFGVFEAFFLFADSGNERRARALVRDAIRYRPEILRLAQSAMAGFPLAGRAYSAMHIRRGDFQFKKTRIGAEEILRHTVNLLPQGQMLYVATDETDPEFLRPFQERYRVVQFQDLAVAGQTPSHWTGIVETLICAAAPERFVGTRLSTFSARIATLRGHMSRSSGEHAGIDTALYYTQPPIWSASPETRAPYALPQRKHEDEHGETATPWWISVTQVPIWGRAYKSVWADT